MLKVGGEVSYFVNLGPFVVADAVNLKTLLLILIFLYIFF